VAWIVKAVAEFEMPVIAVTLAVPHDSRVGRRRMRRRHDRRGALCPDVGRAGWS